MKTKHQFSQEIGRDLIKQWFIEDDHDSGNGNSRHIYSSKTKKLRVYSSPVQIGTMLRNLLIKDSDVIFVIKLKVETAKERDV